MRIFGYELKLIATRDDGQEIDVSHAITVGRVFSHRELVVEEGHLLAVIRHAEREEQTARNAR